MDPKKQNSKSDTEVGQGYNDARGEIPDREDTPKNNGLNVDNDPAHHKAREGGKVEEKG